MVLDLGGVGGGRGGRSSEPGLRGVAMRVLPLDLIISIYLTVFTIAHVCQTVAAEIDKLAQAVKNCGKVAWWQRFDGHAGGWGGDKL